MELVVEAEVLSPALQLDRHRNEWSACNRCILGCTAVNHVLLRRSPLDLNDHAARYDVMFLGEAPGVSEDVLGKPFVGPAGRMLNDIIKDVQQRVGKFSYVITNPVACIPFKTDGSGDTRAPSMQELQSCLPRVLELCHILRPRLLVMLGNIAERTYNYSQAKHLKHLAYPFEQTVKLCHPSYIVTYAKDADLEYKRCVLNLSAAVRKLKDSF